MHYLLTRGRMCARTIGPVGHIHFSDALCTIDMKFKQKMFANYYDC